MMNLVKKVSASDKVRRDSVLNPAYLQFKKEVSEELLREQLCITLQKKVYNELRPCRDIIDVEASMRS